MQWIDAFYSPFPSMMISVGLLAIVVYLTSRGVGRKLALVISILLLTRYMVWRGVYTLNLDSGLSASISLILLLAETYGFVQVLFFSYQAWSPLERESLPIKNYPSVDIMIPVVNEPLYILKRTLIGCLAQTYPKHLIKIFVLDDGPREEVKLLATELGVEYLSRSGRSHAKAGNVNNGLKHASGELVAFFDVDHVPSPNFLMKTVGFFADEEVAIVQTAQGFYNPDIFQKNVAQGRHVHNEQTLFFRTLQSGRDRHNTAFFAGSSGVFRRAALDEIGGFQTETVTEDLHTSLVLHAKGYKSCYLNETLASGLMPETFEAHAKQRARWAMGTAQVLARANPLFMRGLTWPQRIDYLGSIHFFFLGVPRIIYLIAPLSWLVLSVPALKADTSELINFFFSAYLGSILSIKMISRNTRNAFWSDIHETVVCFAVAAATVRGLFSGRRQREFEVTAKGSVSEKKSIAGASTIGWHLGLIGLLAFGITSGVQQWFGPNPAPGLAISLWWASFNIVLLAVAVVPAREQRQLRNLVRRPRKLKCLILDGSDTEDAEILDMSESGVAIQIPGPRYALQKHIRIGFWAEEDEFLTLKGTIVRQELAPNGTATLGVKFEDLDDQTTQALITTLFSTLDTDRLDAADDSGVLGSFWSLLSVLVRLGERLQPSRRRMPRIPLAKVCRLQFDGTGLRGTTQDVSFAGVSAVFPGRHIVSSRVCVLSIDDVELKVSPIKTAQRGSQTYIRFRVESITKGEPEWQAWHQPSSH